MAEAKYWLHRNVFVTGATGLLGSWLTSELARLGANVVILLRDEVPTSLLMISGDIGRVTVVHGQLEDFGLVERALNEYEIDTVFHLGAQTIVGTANRSPLSTFESNIKGTWTLLEAARNSKLVRGIVVASSDKAYGDQPNLPYTEDAPLIGRHPYDVSKSCADLISQAYFHTYGLPVVITRCGNLYGGGDLNFNRIVPGTIRSLVLGESPVIRSDGTFIRDYFYVKDAVEAYISLAERAGEEGIAGEAFNFSNELQIPVLDLVATITRLMGTDIQPTILGEAAGEIHHQYLSAEKARRVLGWHPRWQPEDALVETIDWYRRSLAEGEPARRGPGCTCSPRTGTAGQEA
jgi:CDP-glucose 4,6-dehydratase